MSTTLAETGALNASPSNRKEYDEFAFDHVLQSWKDWNTTTYIVAWYGQYRHLLQCLDQLWTTQGRVAPSRVWTAMLPMVRSLPIRHHTFEAHGVVWYRSTKMEREYSDPKGKTLGIPFTDDQLDALCEMLYLALPSYAPYEPVAKMYEHLCQYRSMLLPSEYSIDFFRLEDHVSASNLCTTRWKRTIVRSPSLQIS